MSQNPFVSGVVVRNAAFIGRKQAIRRLTSRINNRQSTAVVGLPKIGKTSLLNYLDTALQQAPHDDRHIIEFIDSHALRQRFEQRDFWQRALQCITAACDNAAVQTAHTIARDNAFDTYMLERFFETLAENEFNLVLLIDEFDTLLTHPILNSGEFYGSLRSLASRFDSLTLVIACNQSLSQLNQETQKLNPHGSPYFNIFTEIVLKPLPPHDAAALLNRAGERFDDNDRAMLLAVSGRHPYLLQLAASILWELSLDDVTSQFFGAADGLLTAPPLDRSGDRPQRPRIFEKLPDDDLNNRRYEQAGRELLREATPHFKEVWRRRSLAERKALTALGLAELHGKVGRQHFRAQQMLDDLDEFSPELRRLEDDGSIVKNQDGTYHIAQQAFLWWLADEIKRINRDASGFEEWLHAQAFDTAFTSAERQRIKTAAQTVNRELGKGSAALIETFANEAELRLALYKALLDAFRSYAELERMVGLHMDKNLNTLVEQGDLQHIVFKLINWAEAQGRIVELVTKAHEANPGNSKLRAVYVRFAGSA